MLKSILKYSKKIYGRVLRSIAFYPVLISMMFFLMALLMLQFETIELAKSLKEEVPYFFIKDKETSRAILTTLISGILSLTVFSFTMVMVVLSQASANFSPRLLPGLVSNKRHQIILGVYIGSLLYCILVLIVLGAREMDANSVGLSTMLAAVLGVLCVGLFVYFIHSISTAIQINNIIDNIFQTSSKYMDRELKQQANSQLGLQEFKMTNGTTIRAHKSGYFRGFEENFIDDSLLEQGLTMEVLPYVGERVWEGMPVLGIKQSIADKELEKLSLCLHLSKSRTDLGDGLGGAIKLMEIAVKAMSPGINDPGTAINAINNLVPLLIKMMRLPNKTSISVKEGKLVLVRNNILAKDLLQLLVQPIRLYSKKDSSVVKTLLDALVYAERDTEISAVNKEALQGELVALKKDVVDNIDNKLDRERLIEIFPKSINK
ncbi:DUF2254 domain-containing protein [Arenibacter aquaticus]|uniref:DUF2254 domain-containing protein n=1 Tax=Arenibacter aquaticus TaxID=2489054 RepID=A0A3S0AM84_9FLAO|nr:DUF2254 domain-containing protein [Arenibacter aquaticus]RTE53304.1 DUF2254 domain-containing protein [Arenibacter aquaticus]